MTKIASQERLRFDYVDVHPEDGPQCRVEVGFTFMNRLVRASSTDSNEGVGPLKAAASAALKAIEMAAESRFGCSLADLDHVNALGKDLIAVLVNVDFEGKQLQVFGSCQITSSETDAAVRAALNATNRFFDLALRTDTKGRG